MNKLCKIVFVLSTGLALLLAVLVMCGVFDRLTHGLSTGRAGLIGAVAVYWAVGVAALWLAARWRRRWKQLVTATTISLIVLACCEIVVRIVMPQLSVPKFRYVASAHHHHLPAAGQDSHWGSTSDGRYTPARTTTDCAHLIRGRRSSPTAAALPSWVTRLHSDWV